MTQFNKKAPVQKNPKKQHYTHAIKNIYTAITDRLRIWNTNQFSLTCIFGHLVYAYRYIEKHQSNTIKSHKYVTTVVRLFQIKNIL